MKTTALKSLFRTLVATRPAKRGEAPVAEVTSQANAPRELDAQSLRQVAGGASAPLLPKRGW
jgi:hypothetical protein